MHSNSFGPEKRLHYSWEYRRFFNAEVTVSKLRECVIFRIPNEFAHFRLGISLKARGSSIERNRIKRILRESFRAHQARLGNYDYNVLIPAAKRIDRFYADKLRECLENAWKKNELVFSPKNAKSPSA